MANVSGDTGGEAHVKEAKVGDEGVVLEEEGELRGRGDKTLACVEVLRGDRCRFAQLTGCPIPPEAPKTATCLLAAADVEKRRGC